MAAHTRSPHHDMRSAVVVARHRPVDHNSSGVDSYMPATDPGTEAGEDTRDHRLDCSMVVVDIAAWVVRFYRPILCLGEGSCPCDGDVLRSSICVGRV